MNEHGSKYWWYCGHKLLLLLILSRGWQRYVIADQKHKMLLVDGAYNTKSECSTSGAVWWQESWNQNIANRMSWTLFNRHAISRDRRAMFPSKNEQARTQIDFRWHQLRWFCIQVSDSAQRCHVYHWLPFWPTRHPFKAETIVRESLFWALVCHRNSGPTACDAIQARALSQLCN